MPKIDLDTLTATSGSGYPAPHDAEMTGRSNLRLGDGAGLSQFGVNITILAPGAKSSLRHWHENQDEFLIVTAGDLVLVEDQGETALAVGDCAAFPAGTANGHHVVNKSNSEGRFLIVGTRTATETAWYSDHDLMVEIQDGTFNFTRKDGSPLPSPQKDVS